VKKYIKLVKKEKFKESIFLHDFGTFPQEWIDKKVQEKWNFTKKIRSEVNNAIELKRNEKLVGSGLDTNVHISLDEKYLFNFEKIDLPELFICSSSSLNQKDLNFENFQIANSSLEI